MSFKSKVKGISAIKACLKPGKQALGPNSSKVNESLSTCLNGSVDLDACLQAKMPNDNRWDFVLGYEGKAYFIEVHPATEGEIKVVIRKYRWLLNWLKNEGRPLEAIKAEIAFHWLFTNKNGISKRSSSARQLVKAGLPLPKRELVL